MGGFCSVRSQTVGRNISECQGSEGEEKKKKRRRRQGGEGGEEGGDKEDPSTLSFSQAKEKAAHAGAQWCAGYSALWHKSELWFFYGENGARAFRTAKQTERLMGEKIKKNHFQYVYHLQ